MSHRFALDDYLGTGGQPQVLEPTPTENIRKLRTMSLLGWSNCGTENYQRSCRTYVHEHRQ